MYTAPRLQENRSRHARVAAAHAFNIKCTKVGPMQKKSSSQPRALCANAADATERAAEVRERVFRSTDTTATSYATHQKKVNMNEHNNRNERHNFDNNANNDSKR